MMFVEQVRNLLHGGACVPLCVSPASGKIAKNAKSIPTFMPLALVARHLNKAVQHSLRDPPAPPYEGGEIRLSVDGADWRTETGLTRLEARVYLRRGGESGTRVGECGASSRSALDDTPPAPPYERGEKAAHVSRASIE